MSIAIGENLTCDKATLYNFERLLSCTKDRLLKNSDGIIKGDFWKTFEIEVNKALIASKDDVGLNDWKIEYIGGHKFPDIVARINEKQSLGVEVKTISTRNSSWKIMGGSIMESTRIPDVSRIHVFCAKQKPFEIIVNGTFCISVVAKINIACSGGSSSVLSKALKAPVESI